MLNHIAEFFGLKEDAWIKHSNPWSVWTRVITLPFLTIAIWSHIWIGYWALVPILICVVWIKINPVFFSKPKSTKNWSSKSVLGERVWLNKKTHPIPNHHQRFAVILSIIAFIGLIIWGYGLYSKNLEFTIMGLILIYTGKMWFLDRMVWLFEDMKKQIPEYQKWEY